MILSDQQVLDLVNALLDIDGVRADDRVRHLRKRRVTTAVMRALEPVIEHYLLITDPQEEAIARADE